MPEWDHAIRIRLARLNLTPARAAEIHDEVAQHLDDRYRDLRSGGASDQDACAQAIAELSADDAFILGMQRLRQASPPPPPPLPAAPASGRWLDDAWRDLKYAARIFRRQPSFTAIAVLTVALGTGANSAIFSVVNAVLLRPLPFAEPDRLVRLFRTNPNMAGGRQGVCPADFHALRAESRTLESLAFYSVPDGVAFIGNAGPEQVHGAFVTSAFFTVLGVAPILGEGFRPGDDLPGAAGKVVLSERFWRDRLGADPAVLGRSVKLDGRDLQVVGVMPAAFWYPRGDFADFWANLVVPPATRMGPFGFAAIARVRPGVGAAELGADLNGVAARLSRRFVSASTGATIVPRALKEQIVGNLRPMLLLLLGAVAVLLMIACVNVAHLMLVRAGARGQEMALRAALGGSRSRLVRQLLAESVLLAAAGGAAGLALAYWGVRVLTALQLPALTVLADAKSGIDLRVLAVSAAVAIGCGVLFGLAPAMLTSQMTLAGTMNEGAGRATEGRAQRRLRSLLVVFEFALSVLLLVGAGLLIRSLAALQHVDAGVRTDGVVTMGLALPPDRYDTAHTVTFYERLIDELRSVPGVRSAGITFGLPPYDLPEAVNFVVEGHPPPPGEQEPITGNLYVGGDFFETLGIRLQRGRLFTDADTATSLQVAIIDQSFARRFFGTVDPIGRRLSVGGPNSWVTIVGVVSNVHYNGLDVADNITMYTPFRQTPASSTSIVVRADGNPLQLVPAIRARIMALDRELPLTDVKTMDERIAESMAQQRFRTGLLGLFAGVALLLAGVGIYGVLSFAVGRRTHEIGVRLALGARPARVMAIVVRDGLVLAAAGIALGLAAAFAATRVLSTFLFGVTATDPLTFAMVAALLLSVALLACYVPARRASRVDPLRALRAD